MYFCPTKSLKKSRRYSRKKVTMFVGASRSQNHRKFTFLGGGMSSEYKSAISCFRNWASIQSHPCFKHKVKKDDFGRPLFEIRLIEPKGRMFGLQVTYNIWEDVGSSEQPFRRFLDDQLRKLSEQFYRHGYRIAVK